MSSQTTSRAQRSAETMLLGTLVHRAVGLPFQKPWKIDDGNLVFRRGGRPREGIAAAIADAADDLSAALYPATETEVDRLTEAVRGMGLSERVASRILRSIEACDAGGIGEAVIDSGGRWWSAASEDWRRQDHRVQETLLGEMRDLAGRIGVALEQRARDDEWTHLWGEEPVVRAVDSDGIALCRPDLTAFSLTDDWTEVDLVELKTSRGRRVSVEAIDTGVRELHAAFDAYREMTGIEPSLYLLLAPAEGGITWKPVPVEE